MSHVKTNRPFAAARSVPLAVQRTPPLDQLRNLEYLRGDLATNHRFGSARRIGFVVWGLMLIASLVLIGCGRESGSGDGDGPLQVCVSSTDVREIVEAVGGSDVEVTAFVKGQDDPHVVEPTRSMIESLAKADTLVVVGLGLEEAWLPTMIEQAKNNAVSEGGPGYLDLSVNLRTIVGLEGRGVPSSFHPEDNPHYLADPIEGIKAAAAVAEHLATLRPAQAEAFRERARVFAKEIAQSLFGEPLADRFGPDEYEALAIAIERDELAAFLASAPGTGEASVAGADASPPVLGGHLGSLSAYRDQPVIGDHDLWPYFARRYGVRVLGYMEPEPGVPPTAPHLEKLIKQMREADCRVILSVQYFDPRHAAFVAEQTGAVTARLINQPGGRPGTETYLAFIDYNANQLLYKLRKTEAESTATRNPTAPLPTTPPTAASDQPVATLLERSR